MNNGDRERPERQDPPARETPGERTGEVIKREDGPPPIQEEVRSQTPPPPTPKDPYED